MYRVLALVAVVAIAATACAEQAVRSRAVQTPGAASAPAPAAALPPTQATLAPAQAPTVADIARRASDLPAPVGGRGPETVTVRLEAREVVAQLGEGQTYTYWTFGGTVPGPFVRVRVGDTVELHLKNASADTAVHSIDLHAVTGPGGGSGASQVPPGGEKTFRFKALNPGLYVYHCATAPIAMHMTNGMYGLILVEPDGGLPAVDREFYVMQGELYTSAPFGAPGHHAFSYDKMVAERPDYVLFNGRVGALTGDRALKANVGDRVRMYFGDGGFLSSNFHVIGEIFDRVYPEGAVGGEPLHNVQTTPVPAGGSAIVEFTLRVPGRYLLVDHALPRALDKGAVGYLDVAGPDNPAIFSGGTDAGH